MQVLSETQINKWVCSKACLKLPHGIGVTLDTLNGE